MGTSAREIWGGILGGNTIPQDSGIITPKQIWDSVSSLSDEGEMEEEGFWQYLGNLFKYNAKVGPLSMLALRGGVIPNQRSLGKCLMLHLRLLLNNH
jgi:hypothetical protein